MQGLVGEPEAYTKAAAAQPAATTVTVLNGSGITGAATNAGGVLSARGFQVGAPGSSDTTKTTLVRYPSGMEAQAKAVAAVVPGAVAVRSTTVTGVQLVLGTDGKTAQPVAAAPAPAESSAPAAEPAPTESKSSEPAPSSTDVKSYGKDGVCIN